MSKSNIKYENPIPLFLRKVGLSIPFNPRSIIEKILDKNTKTLLDVGCGRGGNILVIKRQHARARIKVVGFDIFKPYVCECVELGVYDDLLICDAKQMPFNLKGSFDVVLCSELIEHMTKREGEKLLDNVEKIALRQVIVTTPVGYTEGSYNKIEEDNTYQIHRSGWDPADFRKRGYKVWGMHPFSPLDKLPLVQKMPLNFNIWFLFPFSLLNLVAFKPEKSHRIIAVKEMSEKLKEKTLIN